MGLIFPVFEVFDSVELRLYRVSLQGLVIFS